MGYSGDLITIYPKPYSIYLRGTIAPSRPLLEGDGVAGILLRFHGSWGRGANECFQTGVSFVFTPTLRKIHFIVIAASREPPIVVDPKP